MTRVRGLALCSIVLAASGCPTRDKYERTPSVRITSPAGEKHTNGIVQITVEIDPKLDLPVVLRRDGITWLTELPPAQQRYDWDTTAVGEGPHQITAEVTLSSGIVTSSAVTIVVDRQPPTVSLTPAPGATDVKLRTPIRAVFSEPVVLSSPAPATFALFTGSTPVPATATMAADGMSATIVIDEPTSLALPLPLSVFVSGAITDRAGNVLPPPTGWSWTVPEWIVAPTFPSSCEPVLNLGADQLPVVGYCMGGAMGVNAPAAARYDGNGWRHTQRAADLGDFSSGGLAVASDSHGTVYLAWPTYGTGSRFITVRRWDGANWMDGIPDIDGVVGSNTNAVSPCIRIDAADRLVVSWIEDGDVFVSRWNGSAWENAWSGGLGLALATAQDLVLDAEGNPAIAWRQETWDQGLSVWNRDWATDSLGSAQQPPTLAIHGTQPPLTAIARGDSISVLRIVDRQPTATVESLTVAMNDRNPRLVLDAAGRPAIVWLQTTARAFGFARWTGDRWNRRAPAFDDGSASLAETVSHQVIADPFGNTWIAWRQGGLVHVRMPNY